MAFSFVRPAAAVLLLWTALPAVSQNARGPLLNATQIHRELRVTPGSEAAVKELLPSFLDYQDIVLFYPKIGYYSSGRVSFSADYRTFPIVLAPYFGQMIGEQIFRMWQGMRAAGTLGPKDTFTIAEFGAGDGGMAESILDYIDSQSQRNADPRWRQFAEQTVYACYDRSPALSESQRQRNARFGKRFEAREGDATNPVATIPAESLKGVILSNELQDAFSVHKVILSQSGAMEAAFVAPVLPQDAWAKIQRAVPAATRDLVKKDDQTIRDKLFAGKKDSTTYLTRKSFIGLLEALAPTAEYNSDMDLLQFHEVYVPASEIPELTTHLKTFAHSYAYEIAKAGRGGVTYVNLGEGQFIQGMGHILKAGYVMTIDYGNGWDGIMPLEFDHLRTFGPNSDSTQSDPYHWPTLNDITTDVNFGHVADEGRLAGLRPMFYGQQQALQAGTSIVIEEPDTARNIADADAIEDYKTWVGYFRTWAAFKVMVQQKEGTDPAYAYPGTNPEPLAVQENDLTAAVRTRLAAIEKRLSGGAESPR
jgi:SAM-dependent MidA family methyltransferase